MSQNDEKITVRFTSSVTDDYNEDDDLLFNSPTNVDKYVDTLDELRKIENPDVGLRVFVNNVLNEGLSQQRGAHFAFTDKGWKETLVGTHNHENKEILDQLGDICIENLPKGTKKLLTISQSNESNGAKSSYDLKWNDYPDTLPEIPNELKNSTVYLTTVDGKYEWKEQIIPTQTFQYKRTRLEQNSRTLLFEDLNYSLENGDEALIFDGGIMVTGEFVFDNITIDDINYGRFTFDETIFDAGDLITVVVIKNGVKGFLDTLANEYVSKADMVDFHSKGTITLKDFVKYKDIEDKADRVHSHSNYSRVGHKHDELYASYYHTHSEYITGAQVYAKIGDVLSTFLNTDVELTQDDVNKLYSKAINNLKRELTEKMAEMIDSSYVDAKIEELKSLLNVDDITIEYSTSQGVKTIPLSSYLSLLEERVNNVSSNTDNVVTTKDINVNGVDEIGSYVNGDKISAGTPLTDIITNLVQKELIPTLVFPDVDLEYYVKEGTYEPGDNLLFIFKPLYYQNNGGKLKTIKLYKTGNDEIVDRDEYDVVYTYDFIQEYKLGTDMEFELSVTDGEFFIGRIEAEYDAGEIIYDNFGRPYSLPNGKIIKEFVMSSKRKCFVGKTNGDVRNAPQCELDNKDFSVHISELDNRDTIVLAFPSNTINITDIIYRQQNCTVMDLFERSVENISGANDYKPIPYDIYKFKLTQVNVQGMDFDIKVGDLNE